MQRVGFWAQASCKQFVTKQNRLQFLFAAKATTSKQQISIIFSANSKHEANCHIHVSQSAVWRS